MFARRRMTRGPTAEFAAVSQQNPFERDVLSVDPTYYPSAPRQAQFATASASVAGEIVVHCAGTPPRHSRGVDRRRLSRSRQRRFASLQREYSDLSRGHLRNEGSGRAAPYRKVLGGSK